MKTCVLKTFRERHGMTQTELGIALGIAPENAQQRISHYESDRREIPLEIAYAFIDLASELGRKRYRLEDIYAREKYLA